MTCPLLWSSSRVRLLMLAGKRSYSVHLHLQDMTNLNLMVFMVSFFFFFFWQYIIFIIICKILTCGSLVMQWNGCNVYVHQAACYYNLVRNLRLTSYSVCSCNAACLQLNKIEYFYLYIFKKCILLWHLIFSCLYCMWQIDQKHFFSSSFWTLIQ